VLAYSSPAGTTSTTSSSSNPSSTTASSSNSSSSSSCQHTRCFSSTSSSSSGSATTSTSSTSSSSSTRRPKQTGFPGGVADWTKIAKQQSRKGLKPYFNPDDGPEGTISVMFFALCWLLALKGGGGGAEGMLALVGGSLLSVFVLERVFKSNHEDTCVAVWGAGGCLQARRGGVMSKGGLFLRVFQYNPIRNVLFCLAPFLRSLPVLGGHVEASQPPTQTDHPNKGTPALGGRPTGRSHIF
jgi:hypothetical protein